MSSPARGTGASGGPDGRLLAALAVAVAEAASARRFALARALIELMEGVGEAL